MEKSLKLIIFLLIILGFNVKARSEVMVTAKLDSVNVLMGKLTTLHLEVVKDIDKPGDFPLFRDADKMNGYVGVCGDSVELRLSIQTDTVNIGSGRMQINYSVPVQAFDSGTYRLPRFEYVVGKDTARSNYLTFNVVPVNVTADDPIAGFAPVAEPENPKFYDFVPDWILDFWWIFIVLVLAIIAFMWAMRRYKTMGSILPVKPELTPYEKAIISLSELKEKKLWEQGMEKEYFTDLTDILRIYLQGRFGINAMEMTTRQINDTLRNSDLKDKKNYIKDVLDIADFVKFAKVRPLPEDNIGSYEKALKFVEETKPEEKETNANKDDDISENYERDEVSEKGGEI